MDIKNKDLYKEFDNNIIKNENNNYLNSNLNSEKKVNNKIYKKRMNSVILNSSDEITPSPISPNTGEGIS